MSSLIDQAKLLSWVAAARQCQDFYKIRSQAKLMLQGSRPVQDPLVVAHIKQTFNRSLFDESVNINHLHTFKNTMHDWLHQHPGNRILGLDQMSRNFSAGTTQSFDSFYYRHRHRRMRCLVGEYFYHLKSWIANQVPWSFLSDTDPLDPGDALVISLPFCDTGDQPRNFENLLDQCDKMAVPVLIDCCYYTISTGIHADLSRNCVDTVAFSLSKAFPLAHLRIGLRYTKPDVQDGQTLHDVINYNNCLAAYLGTEIIRRFGADHVYQTYCQQQQEVCDYFGLEPSQSVIFASGDHGWDSYSRKHLLAIYKLDLDASWFNNRICLVSFFDNWDIFQKIKHENTILS